MTGEELNDYLARSGDREILSTGELHEEPGRGWIIFDRLPECLFIHQCYGDGRFWDAYCESLALGAGIPELRFATRRKPEAFKRRFGYDLQGYVLAKRVAKWQL